MSSCTKRKHVINELLHNNVGIGDNQKLAKVVKSRGNHLYEVRTAENEHFLASMPSKFRNTIWIKQGSIVIVESIEEGNKVKGEIVNVLLKEQVKQLKKNEKWLNDFNSLANEHCLPPEVEDEFDITSSPLS